MSKSIDSNQLLELAEKVANKTMKMDLTWDWSCGVAYYGLSLLYETTGEERYIEFLEGRIDELIELGLPKQWTVNTCAMGHALLTLYEKTNKDIYLELLNSKIDYLKHDALRFGEGVLQHTVSAKDDFPGQAWADTLFMAAFLMLRVGVKFDDKELVNDALNQYYWHSVLLQNTKTGLFYHCYDERTDSHLSSVYWARANAWAAYTMSQVGRHLPKSYLYPLFMDISGSLNEQLTEIKYYQTADGLWRTILDDEESYEETSAAAGIAAAMVAQRNPLHRKYVEKALEGISQNIDTDGSVRNVSAGTAVMTTSEDYRDISKKWIQGWGQGLTLTLLAELLRIENQK